jgi:hypothetical protein
MPRPRTPGSRMLPTPRMPAKRRLQRRAGRPQVRAARAAAPVCRRAFQRPARVRRTRWPALRTTVGKRVRDTTGASNEACPRACCVSVRRERKAFSSTLTFPLTTTLTRHAHVQTRPAASSSTLRVHNLSQRCFTQRLLPRRVLRLRCRDRLLHPPLRAPNIAIAHPCDPCRRAQRRHLA